MLPEEIITRIKSYIETLYNTSEEMFGESVTRGMVIVERTYEPIVIYSCDKYYLALIDAKVYQHHPRSSTYKFRGYLLFNSNGDMLGKETYLMYEYIRYPEYYSSNKNFTTVHEENYDVNAESIFFDYTVSKDLSSFFVRSICMNGITRIFSARVHPESNWRDMEKLEEKITKLNNDSGRVKCSPVYKEGTRFDFENSKMEKSKQI